MPTRSTGAVPTPPLHALALRRRCATCARRPVPCSGLTATCIVCRRAPRRREGIDPYRRNPNARRAIRDRQRSDAA